MAKKQLRLLRVVTRGPGLPDTVARFGGVEYRREPSNKAGIYMTLQLPGRLGGLTGIQRDDEGMKVTAIRFPLSRSVGVEFCGTEIASLAQAAGVAETNAGAVLALRPLLTQVQATFRAT